MEEVVPVPGGVPGAEAARRPAGDEVQVGRGRDLCAKGRFGGRHEFLHKEVRERRAGLVVLGGAHPAGRRAGRPRRKRAGPAPEDDTRRYRAGRHQRGDDLPHGFAVMLHQEIERRVFTEAVRHPGAEREGAPRLVARSDNGDVADPPAGRYAAGRRNERQTIAAALPRSQGLFGLSFWIQLWSSGFHVIFY